jgi:hypothetical protein
MAKRQVPETWMRWVPVIVVAAGVIAAWGRFDVRVGALEAYRGEHTAFAERTLARIDTSLDVIGKAVTGLQHDVKFLTDDRKAQANNGNGGAMVGMPPGPHVE